MAAVVTEASKASLADEAAAAAFFSTAANDHHGQRHNEATATKAPRLATVGKRYFTMMMLSGILVLKVANGSLLGPQILPKEVAEFVFS